MSPGRIPLLAVAADLVAVLVFAAAGRLAHGEADDLLGLLGTVAPFALGVAVSRVLPPVRTAPAGLRAGARVLAVTAVVGLLVRAAFLGRLPLTFIAVAVVSLAVLLLGWRGLSAVVARRVAHR